MSLLGGDFETSASGRRAKSLGELPDKSFERPSNELSEACPPLCAALNPIFEFFPGDRSALVDEDLLGTDSQ